MALAIRWTPAAVLILPAAIFVLLFMAPSLDREALLPLVNFIGVTAIALLASGIALVLAIASLRIGAYRVLFVTLGFVVMGFLYGIDGIATPGVLFSALALKASTVRWRACRLSWGYVSRRSSLLPATPG